MKILSGKLKGRNFYMPKDIRPTQDRLRKAIFDIFGQDLSGYSFLDLYAGSGSIGLEAISCNASSVIFVENDSRCAQLIEDNLTALKLLENETVVCPFQVIAMDVFRMIEQFYRRKKMFDIIFLDPPYYAELGKKTLKTLYERDILTPTSFIIVQHDKRDILPEPEAGFFLVRQRSYGNSELTIYKREVDSDSNK